MSAVPRELPGIYDVVTEREFVSPDEHRTLLDWAEEQFSSGQLEPNITGKQRFYRSYGENDPAVPRLFWDLRGRAVSRFGVTAFEDEPEYRCFLGCNTEGGFVQRHVDTSPPGKHHVRLNLMISKPLGGGDPIIDDRTIEVNERDLWCFFPSFMPHASAPVVGARKRFVISIGILVPAALCA